MTETPLAEEAVLDGIAKIFGGYVAGRNADAAALRDLNASLMQQLAECRGDGDGPGFTTFGSSMLGALTGADAQAGVAAGRAYVGTGKTPTSWTQLPADQRATINLATEAVVLSWKERPGDWLDQLLNTIRRDKPEMLIYGCQNHEPYDNFTTAGALADYHRRWQDALPIMQDNGVLPTTILDGSRPESWDDFAISEAAVQGMDRYNPGIGSPKSYQRPADVFGPYLEWLAGFGSYQGLIGETGTGRTAADNSGAGQLSWTIDAHDFLEGKVGVACWWSQDALTLTPGLLHAWLTGDTL